MNNPPGIDFALKGRAILVTGASRGIGKAIALKLGECGAKVGVTYTGASASSESNAKEVCEKIVASGGEALALPLDISQEAQVEEAVSQFTKKFGGMQGLVNNAGMTVDQLLMRFKSDDWDKVLDTNLKGTFLMCRASSRALMKAGGSSVVNMSSVVGQMGNAGQIAYSAAKAGLIGMTKTLARELGSRAVRVNCIAPGFIETDMTHALNEEQKTQLTTKIPLQQLGSADDIAYGTLYLLSPLSRYVTGQILAINGGMYM